MSEDFLDELAELALGSRLKRLSERMLANAADVYEEFGMDINPKWFTLLALLDDKHSVTIVEASSLLGLSQPALSQFCKELQFKGLVVVNKGNKDSRKRFVSLTDRGRQCLTHMKPIWFMVKNAAVELCTEHDNNFYQSLLRFEKAFEAQNLLTRTKAQFASKKLTNSNQQLSEITILPYTPDLAHYFETINKHWINDMFVLEDIDKKVFGNPQRYIIAKVGSIWFAKHAEFGIVGTCALLNKGDGAYELTKMGVLSSARGLKVGERLLQFVISQVNNKSNINHPHIKKLFLLTNSKCEAAIHLYEKNGFVHSKQIMADYGKLYKRCNVAMAHSLHRI